MRATKRRSLSQFFAIGRPAVTLSPAQARTESHKIAQQNCLTVFCKSTIGEMVLSNCARSSLLPLAIGAADVWIARRRHRVDLS
jgi:hypothetical protein